MIFPSQNLMKLSSIRSKMGRIDRKYRKLRGKSGTTTTTKNVENRSTVETELDPDSSSIITSFGNFKNNGYDRSISSSASIRGKFVDDEDEREIPWRKILYEKQPFPDNYCSRKFLNELQKNVTAKTYELSEAIRGSLILMHQVNSVVLYVLAFVFVDDGLLEWHFLLVLCSATVVVGYFVHAVVLGGVDSGNGEKNGSARRRLKTLTLYVGFGYGLSPIFKTLTETISTDTIYALTAMMFVINIAFADYGVDVAVVSSALSLNAGIFGAVCLISRLSTSNEVFALLTLAVEMFVLWPILRWQISARNSKNDVWMASISASLVLCGLFRWSNMGLFVYALGHTFVSLICPLGLMKMQPLKSTIHGPWDEAIVTS